MANYPTSLDTLTNPTGTNTQDSPGHAGQHSDVNDICEELEKKVGVDASTPTEGKSLVGGAVAGSSTWKDIDHISDADSDTRIRVEKTADEDKIHFDTAGLERMILDHLGNAGLGTPTPTVQLEQTKNFGSAGAFKYSLAAYTSSASVTFPVAFPSGTVPVVVVTPSYQTSVWVTNVTNTGFTLNVGTQCGPYAATMYCHAFLDTA